MQVVFISRRDNAAAKREHAAARKEFERMDNQIQKRLDYVARLAGMTYDERDLLEKKIQESGRVLERPRKHSTLP